MKHLRSTLKDFRHIFDLSLTVRFIAEPLISFDAQRDAADVRKIMEEREFDVVGVREGGSITGMVNREELGRGILSGYKKRIDEDSYVEDWQPMLSVLEKLTNHTQVFVLAMGEVSGIVMRGDLQKAPVRMWFFGVLSLFEMQLLRIIRVAFPNEDWKKLLNKNRLAAAEILLKDRKSRNEQIDLADCLQFSDKREIIISDVQLREALGLESKTKGKDLLGKLERLRNDLAHSQDFISGRWPELVELIKRGEQLLEACESYYQ